MQTDKTTTESKQPLYKVLNEQRTQGDIVLSKNKQVLYCGVLAIGTTYNYLKDEEQNIINAQYTALAVNNLHHLAEALEKIKNECLKALARQAAGEEFSLKSLIGAIAETSVDALIRIS